MRIKATGARVEWDSVKNQWEVYIQVGAEVIKRHLPDETLESSAEAIRQRAAAIANDEGYALDPQQIEVLQASSPA